MSYLTAHIQIQAEVNETTKEECEEVKEAFKSYIKAIEEIVGQTLYDVRSRIEDSELDT